MNRCSKCNGFGVVVIQPFNLVVTCNNCYGSREEPKTLTEILSQWFTEKEVQELLNKLPKK